MLRKILKTTLLVITLITIMAISVFAQYTDVPENANYYNAVASLSKAGIIGGYSDGSFKPKNNLTRAEFTKMAVVALGKEDEAELLKNSTIFSDVSQNHWAAGYINIAVKNKIITGYANGTFKPEEKIDFSQVVTILLRILGYSSEQMTGVWPQNYLEKAKILKITTGIKFNPSDKVNRADTAVMFERALNADKGTNEQTLAEQSGIGTSKTCIITDSWDLDDNLAKGTIKTDIGDFKSESIKGIDYLGKKVNLLVDSNDNIISAQSVEQDSKIIFVENISGNKISYIDKSGTGTIDIADGMTFYYQGAKATYESVKQNISIGSVIALALADQATSIYNFGVLTDPPTYEPVVVKKNVNLSDTAIGSINISNKNAFTVFKNGEKADILDIQQYDVVYLVKNPFKSGKEIILVYDDKTTGTYDEALPSKASVSSIKILGKELKIETSYAAESVGAFAIGDSITVLTGKTGKIVDVMAPFSSDISNYAVVLDARKSVSTEADSIGREIYFVKIYKIDGTTAEYEADEDQSERIGDLVKYDFKDDKVDIIPFVYTPISGRVNISDRTIGDKYLSTSAVIFDINNDYSSGNIQVKKLRWQDMPEGDLAEDKVIHAEAGGDFNDIQLLVMDNYTEAGQYGILVSQTKRETSANYTLLINGEQKSFNNCNALFDSFFKDVVYIEQNEGGLQKMTTLNPKDSASEIQAIDSRRIKINNVIYNLAENLQIYDLSTNSPVSISMSDLTTQKVKYVSIYRGVQTNNENIIKIITIKRY